MKFAKLCLLIINTCNRDSRNSAAFSLLLSTDTYAHIISFPLKIVNKVGLKIIKSNEEVS